MRLARGWSEDPTGSLSLQKNQLWEPLPAAGATRFPGAGPGSQQQSFPTPGRVGSGRGAPGEGDSGRHLGRGAWWRLLSPGRDKVVEGPPLPPRGSGTQALGAPQASSLPLGLCWFCHFCVCACCCSGVCPPGIAFWKQVQGHLVLDEKCGFLFLENSVPSHFPALAPAGPRAGRGLRAQCQ